MKNLSLLFILLLLLFSNTSCSDDEPQLPDVDCSEDLSALFGFELLNINTEIEVYNMDPSQANCITVRDAINSFLQDAKPYENCTEITPELMELTDAITVLEDNLELLSC